MTAKDITWDRQNQFHLLEVVAQWEGRVTTEHLQRAFGINSRTTASHILKDYLKDVPGNLKHSVSYRGYVPNADFRPRYSRGELGEYLSLMTRHNTLNPSFAGLKDLPAPTESLSLPHRAVSTDVVRQVVQATQARSRLEVVYRSLSTPEGEDRIIAPHTLVYSGLRWHVRAWCEKHRNFRDFVLTRMNPGAELIGEALTDADPSQDYNWQNHIVLRLAPNSGLTAAQQRMVALDYGMGNDHELKVPVRCALAHYLMQSLNIFWSSEKCEPREQPLVVINREEVEPFVFGGSAPRP
ncbi:WYL domain-containing protein [Marinobacter orientalis]|uniref:WYL domain-containing protein n=1 Tax=Marinobacter orientalis TaxID=1928859 RepID=A0A7Y0RC32_9GAMM|nr:WYL domain-containing protein [Marinobacter orientalis]NMT63481.1 WYL domain-containing protein [Marinobacter orientalis]TGX48542.1 WYL domain-containing protein [Marinobacter orientalis]